MNVGFISLGCSKNLIDTEVTIGKFKEHRFNVVNDPKHADIIVINTCGFIESAKVEAINTILEMAEYKNKRCKYLIVMGCLVERYYKDLVKSLPEVDMFIKIEDYNNLWDKIEKLISCQKEPSLVTSCQKEPPPLTGATMFAEKEYLTREVSTGENYAYLKIGEGCSNFCTYCAIPYIRGLFVSRPFEDIIEEAKILAKKGIKDLIVIAQDTTKYGLDLYGKPRLAELLQELSNIKEFKWIRFLYSYPEGITDELINVVKENDKICKYFDIPIQHISNDVLKRMNRKTSKENIKEALNSIDIDNKISNTFNDTIKEIKEILKEGFDKSIIVEGIRSPFEVDLFKENFDNFIILSVFANPKLRFERIKSRQREDDTTDYEIFVERDQRELDFGIGVVISLSDKMIINESDLESYEKEIREFFEEYDI